MRSALMHDRYRTNFSLSEVALRVGTAHFRTSSRNARVRGAFTLVELLVVISVIGIILLITLPGLSGMLRQVRNDAAYKTVSSFISKAYFRALADSNTTAVRIFPGAWDFSELSETNTQAAGRQHLALYSFRGDYRDGNGLLQPPNNGVYTEYFSRVSDEDSLILPAEVWAAPAETVSAAATNTNSVYQNALNGQRGFFSFSNNFDESLVDADDFLLIFDPQDGLRSGLPTDNLMKIADARENRPTGDPAEWLGRTPWDGTNSQRFLRKNFTGLTFYNRNDFAALDRTVTNPATADVRQSWLQRNSTPVFVRRHGGGLVSGTAGAP